MTTGTDAAPPGSDAARLAHAAAYAVEAHAGQTRKGTSMPYASHVLAVGALVLEHGGTTDQAVAGLLHDVVEDCGGAERRADVARVFGPEVTALVDALTDGVEGDARDANDWRRRKEAYHAHLDGLDASRSAAVLVSACDKLHNLRSIVDDLTDPDVGTAVFARFNAGSPAETVWNQRELVDRYRAAVEAGLVPARLHDALETALAVAEAAVAVVPVSGA
ncbi:MAG: HD domain-containing protein [Nitriliruptoraceae bacterium]